MGWALGGVGLGGCYQSLRDGSWWLLCYYILLYVQSTDLPSLVHSGRYSSRGSPYTFMADRHLGRCLARWDRLVSDRERLPEHPRNPLLPLSLL